MRYAGGIEVGGTKTVCAVVSTDGDIVERTQFATREPAGTLRRALEFFDAQPDPPLDGLGVGHFGPIQTDTGHPQFGHVLNTPKRGWSGMDVIGALSAGTRLSVRLDTDVNAALRGERRWGVLRGISDAVYLTIGTGIGGGVLTGGRPVVGQLHPEVGHMLLAQDADDREFVGACPFHGSACAEGLASGPAMAMRWSANAEDLDDAHPAWDLEARYLAALCTNLFVTLSCRRIVLGGGVMQHRALLDKVRSEFIERLNGYIDLDSLGCPANELLVAPGLGVNAGVLGAAALVLDDTHEKPT